MSVIKIASPLAGFLLRTVIVALAYFVTGELGIQLAVYPGNATAIWPPSGIALAAVLVWGRGMWLGIVLGYLAIAVVSSQGLGTIVNLQASLLLPLSHALGAAAQSLLGRFMIQRSGGISTALGDPHDIGRLMILGGAIACLFNASFSAGCLLLSGDLSPEFVFDHWLRWYAGDTIGVMIFTPVCMVFLPGRAMNRQRAVFLAAVMLGGFTITAWVGSLVQADNRAELDAKFATLSGLMVADLGRSIIYHVSAVNALEALFSTRDEITADEFRDFSARIRDKFGGVANISWIPRVAGTELSQFETWARNNVSPDFKIKGSADQALPQAPDQHDHFPVTFIEPLAGNQSAVGFDLGSSPPRLATLERGRDQGALAVTERIRLVQDGNSAVLMTMPVYRKGLTLNEPGARRIALKGFIKAAIRLDELIGHAFSHHDLATMLIWLQDETNANAPVILFSNSNGTPLPFVFGKHSLFGPSTAIKTSTSMTVGGRTWVLHLAPTNVFVVRNYSSNGLLILAVGFIFTVFIGSFALIITGRAQSLSRLVEERTAELSASERLSSDILNSFPSPIAITNQSGVIIQVNDAWVNFGNEKGMPPGSGREGSNYLEVCQSSSLVDTSCIPVADGIHAVLNGDRSEFLSEYPCDCPDSPRWFKMRVWPLQRSGGGAVIIHDDITERKVMERTITDRDRFIASIANNIPGLVVYWDTALRCKFANINFEEWFGKSQDQMLGITMLELLGEDIYSKNLPFVRGALAGEYQAFERAFPKANGDVCYRWAQYLPDLDENRVIRGFIALITDVTPIKAAENRLVAINQELTKEKECSDAANRAKSDFLAMMSHEIRTPLNTIIGFSDSLFQVVMVGDHAAKIKKISLAGNHLLNVINGILDVSKIDSGMMQIEHEPFSLTELIENVSIQINPFIESKGLRLITDINHTIPEWMIGDVTRLAQCLINYAGNAVKFTKEGSVALIVSIEYQDELDMRLRFDVVDTGIGIEPEVHSRLFKPFEQADKSTTRRFGGTGLGLALTSQLVKLMGGTVGVDSVPGSGSRFWFTVMVQRAPEDAVSNRWMEPSNPAQFVDMYSNTRLLVAEDVAMNREVLQDILDQSGLEADFAENGEVAVNMARATNYDLILMDMQMPVMDGLSATQAIRTLPGYSDIPIIALTANAFSEDRERCRVAGMNDFLSKPLRAHLLRTKLAEWLAKRPSSASSALPEPVRPLAAPIGDFERVQECLGGIDDIDLTQVPTVQTKPTRYIRYLTEYAEGFADCMADLRIQLLGGDMDAALRLVLSLRGASGQIGVTGIERLAAELGDAIKLGASHEVLLASAGEIERRMATVFGAVSRLKMTLKLDAAAKQTSSSSF